MRDRPRTIGVVIGAAEAAVVAEGLRAAVGLTLRGDRVEVAIAEDAAAEAGAGGERALATLAMFGHPVRVLGPEADADAAADALAADVVELWGDAGPAVGRVGAGPQARLHLLRPGRRVAIATSRDWVLHLPGPAAAAHDDDHDDALLDAILAADVVLVW